MGLSDVWYRIVRRAEALVKVDSRWMGLRTLTVSDISRIAMLRGLTIRARYGLGATLESMRLGCGDDNIRTSYVI